MTETSYLPAPEQLCLVKMTEIEVAEMIERHIDFVDKDGRSVHLRKEFVRHYMNRDDGALPTVVAIAQLPIVLADGTILAKQGLDRDRGIIFDIPEELMKYLPKREECDDAAVLDAFTFLMDEWLVDVSCDFAGKCIIIAAALTIIERSLLDQRPAFFVTAGRRGGGKTTTLQMLIMAVMGIMAPAAAWSPNEEERRKALLSYFMAAVAFIIWDNIPRGAQISCPHIERSCTSAYYSDRKLGVSEMVATAASTIHLFTGNNIGPKGDLASRSLQVRLEVNRADPENRPFKHPDPIGWTEAHRGQIMAALYTLLLGNRQLRRPIGAQAKTRFKMWWRLVGSAIESAAVLAGGSLDFQSLFLQQEETDEDGASLADVLEGMAWKWPDNKQVPASDIAKEINDRTHEFMSDRSKQLGESLHDLLFADLPPNAVVTAKGVSKRLKRHLGEPVKRGERTYTLRQTRDSHTEIIAYWVAVG